MSERDQHEILKQRARYSSKTALPGIESSKYLNAMHDPVYFNLHHLLSADDTTTAFLSLFQHAKNGRLKDRESFTQLCMVFDEKLTRELKSPTAKYGQRYLEHYTNFMILMCSFGPNSRRQYELFKSQLEGPSIRHLR